MNLQSISGFCCEVGENCACLGYYAERSGNLLPTFWDNKLVLPSGVKDLRRFPLHDTAVALQNGVYQRKLLQTACCNKSSLLQWRKWWETFINGSAMFMGTLQSIGPLYVAGQKRERDGEVRKAQFLDVLHQPETWWWQCTGTVKEWFSLTWCREE